ncbi:MAG: tetraacyldisaccharide 4'-kinase [Candidatus Omnitrophota bacterium]|nr:MAG: tetraacyldisaccharide 4'-kinase [Candidatus Omnitrophota bacterium]
MLKSLKKYYIDLAKGRRKGVLFVPFEPLLILPSFIYGLVVRLILLCYEIGLFKSYKADCRVISVGNITWGGTGKTPLVEALARFLKKEGKSPAVLIRGYGRDEAYMLRDKLKGIPVLAGRDRIKSAREACMGYGADILILDDGFQHWRLRRNLDIVLVDASSPFGNGGLIPRGILRESLSSLARADVFVLSRADANPQKIEAIKKELRRYNPRAPIYQAVYTPSFLRRLNPATERYGLSKIKNEKVALVSGIADPQYFSRIVDSLGAEIALEFCFPDHYQYNIKDLQNIQRQCLEKSIKYIITTEKDAARMRGLLNREKLNVELLALCIEIKIIDNEEGFLDFIRTGKDGKVPYSILVLSDGKAGHLNQSKALVRIIQKIKKDAGVTNGHLSSRIVEVKFRNGLWRILLGLGSIFPSGICLWLLRFCLKKDSFCELMQSPADIIISAGSSLSSVNLPLTYKNKARNIVLMKPALANLDRFDLAVIPEHDHIRPRNNVLLTRIAPNLIDQEYLEKQANTLDAKCAIRNAECENKAPRIGLLIGGDTSKYRIGAKLINKIIEQLKSLSHNFSCQILATTSRRTPKIAEELLKNKLAGFPGCKLLIIANEKNIPEAVGGILALSDIVIVSGESISMVSEAVSAQKYVLVFEMEKKVRTSTRQERFLKALEQEGVLKVIAADNLAVEIERLWNEKPHRRKIKDNERIYQALGELI